MGFHAQNLQIRVASVRGVVHRKGNRHHRSGVSGDGSEVLHLSWKMQHVCTMYLHKLL